jgi:hypothetical protein
VLLYTPLKVNSQEYDLRLLTSADFPAHTNYVELCLLLLGRTESRFAKLLKVFPYVGEDALFDTKQGRAPPLVSGTFGPIDAFESILGEIKDQKNGKLGDLGLLDEVRLARNHINEC